MVLGKINKCWICTEEKICLPYRSNPKGIIGGRVVMICGECRRRLKND